jgi:hypothetical protein
MGGFNLTNVLDPIGNQDATTKSYVDALPIYNASYWTGTNYNASYWTGTNYNSSYLTAATDDDSAYLFINGTRAMTGNMSMGSKYINSIITGGLGTDAVNKSYVDSMASNYNASYVTLTNTSYVVVSGINAMTGNLSLGSKYITNLVTGGLGTDAVNKTYADSKSYNSSYLTSTYNSTYDAKISNPVFGYLTLMSGSAMITTTNPGTMNQYETTTNKNNFIYLNFTDGGTETAQWIVDFPADWNSSANVIFTPIWTAPSGSGTVKFDVSGKLFPNDAAIDTALASIGTSTDTLITVGDMHVSPDTTGAVITSVATGGNTAIINVARDSATDSLGGTAQLLGLRIKYSRILA